MSDTKVQVRHLADDYALYRHFDGQTDPQGAYVELGTEDGILCADYDGIIGNGIPSSVYHSIDLRWGIPPLAAPAANTFLDQLEPLAQRVLDGATVDWDGNNRVGSLNTDAQAASDEIQALCDAIEVDDSSTDLIQEWTIDTIGETWDADEAGVTARTSDEQLGEIETRLLEEFRDGMSQPYAIIHGLDRHLRGLRDELRTGSLEDWASALDDLQAELDVPAAELASHAADGWLAGAELAAEQPAPTGAPARLVAAKGWVLEWTEADGWWTPETGAADES